MIEEELPAVAGSFCRSTAGLGIEALVDQFRARLA